MFRRFISLASDASPIYVARCTGLIDSGISPDVARCTRLVDAGVKCVQRTWQRGDRRNDNHDSQHEKRCRSQPVESIVAHVFTPFYG